MYAPTQNPAEKIKRQNQSSRLPTQLRLGLQSTIVDNRPGVAQLKAHQAMMDAGPHQQHLQALQARMAQASQLKANKTGLPDNLKSGIESLSGISMDHVKVHYNSDKPAQLNAHAYAQGSDIHVAPGQEQHLPHEAWHVVQQAQGRVKPTTQMKAGVPVNDDAGLEREADVMGAKALLAVGPHQPVNQPMLKQHDQLSGSGLIQRAPAVVGAPAYTPGTNGCAGSSVLVVRLDGSIFAEGYNSPGGYVPGDRELKADGKNGDYRMHLVNGRLGGAGLPPNLAWGAPKHNREHVRLFENFMQDDARNVANIGKNMTISVTATYHPDDPAVPWKKYFLHSLSCSYAIANGTHSLAAQPITISEVFSEDFDAAEYDPAAQEMNEQLTVDDYDLNARDFSESLDSKKYGRGMRVKNQNPGGRFVAPTYGRDPYSRTTKNKWDK